MKKKFDWTTVWLVSLVVGLLLLTIGGAAFEVLKFVAVVKYVFS